MWLIIINTYDELHVVTEQKSHLIAAEALTRNCSLRRVGDIADWVLGQGMLSLTLGRKTVPRLLHSVLEWATEPKQLHWALPGPKTIKPLALVHDYLLLIGCNRVL